ncbi:MAG: sigma-70 family RNA polymerase sigma factor [Elusimicrobia bacterium]|nr:sigma-70 family RNA polymerase sigma factor [Candidatus Liberimonas magnetica]
MYFDDCMPLVKSIAGKYYRYGVEFDDLVQEGMLGVLEARKNFNTGKKTKFSTYAVFWIKKKMLEYLNKEKRISLNAAEIDDAIEITGINDQPSMNPIDFPDDMPEIEKQVLKYIYEEKKSLKVIAEILGIRREKARQIKFKALRRLKSKKIFLTQN